jgi:hypothetical protein
LRNLNRKFSVFLALAVAVAAYSAVVASASAVVKFSPGGNIKAATSGLTIKLDGANAKTCTLPLGYTNGYVEGTGGFLGSFGEVKFNCSGSTSLTMDMGLTAGYNSTTSQYYLELPNSPTTIPSPYGYYLAKANRPTWVNGSGTTKSVLKFEETVIGLAAANGTITATGTFEFSTSTGGLLTLVQ